MNRLQAELCSTARLPGKRQNDRRKTQLLDMLRSNNNGPTFHALPGTSFIDEGFLNFEQVMSIVLGNIEEQFGTPVSQISPAFAKDIVARFASYLGRQGQPVVQYTEQNVDRIGRRFRQTLLLEFERRI
ncbi:hypothetical protein [Parasedimentitalea psychrophila]|uniref:Uncharacterized protein n=1 Tax=Parasedimentitalea psychrophila TaxID=2997337 RepID=A0A9Y2KXE1_9RHOB|nr:hypothetical protein [Parasedimentitalea psychrophila]WIY24433.1 hypothetical protein QPJ95_17940 [Parasedimentitalea psychrophila]